MDIVALAQWRVWESGYTIQGVGKLKQPQETRGQDRVSHSVRLSSMKDRTRQPRQEEYLVDCAQDGSGSVGNWDRTPEAEECVS